MQPASWQRFAKRTFLVGKRSVTYIFPSADFWASRGYYFDTYTINLELDDNFKVFFDLVYLYIYIYFIVRGHPATGQHTLQIFSLIYLLWCCHYLWWLRLWLFALFWVFI